MPVTNRMLIARKENDCFGITAERKYYHVGNSFIKRSLRPHEWQVSPIKGTIHVPRLNNERLFNEAATLNFVREHSNIPVPSVYACFEDDNAFYLITKYISGVPMNALTDQQKDVIRIELESHLVTLHSLRSSKLGGVSGLIILPYRATKKTPRDEWDLKDSKSDEYMFCHNDLSQQNVIVDPKTLKIAAIIDREYAGFFPEFFERRFFERTGPSVAIGDEKDDSDKLVEFVKSRQK